MAPVRATGATCRPSSHPSVALAVPLRAGLVTVDLRLALLAEPPALPAIALPTRLRGTVLADVPLLAPSLVTAPFLDACLPEVSFLVAVPLDLAAVVRGFCFPRASANGGPITLRLDPGLSASSLPALTVASAASSFPPTSFGRKVALPLKAPRGFSAWFRLEQPDPPADFPRIRPQTQQLYPHEQGRWWTIGGR